METNAVNESGKKVALETLSREDLIKRCERLLGLAQKAKQAKDTLQEENNELKDKLKNGSEKDPNVTSEIIENLTKQKLDYVTTIENLKQQNSLLSNKFQELQLCEERNNVLDNENVSFKRQIRRLTDENEQLIAHLEALEKQMEECKKLGMEQQNQLLILEKSKQVLEDANQKLQNEKTNNHAEELQKMLNISLQEVKKLQSENSIVKERVDDLKTNLLEKDKNILTIAEELKIKNKLIEQLQAHLEELRNSEQLDILSSDNASLQAQNKELNKSNPSLAPEITDLQENKLEEMKQSNKKLKEKLKSYHSKIVKLAGNVKILRENKQEILMLFKTYTNQVEEWKRQLKVASENLYLQIKNIETQNEEYVNENRILKENNAHYMELLEAHKSKQLDQLENIKSDNTRLNDEVARLLGLQEDYCMQIEALSKEKDSINMKLNELIYTHNEELQIFDDKSKKDSIEIQNRIEENEKICIEYRKVISKLEEDISLHVRELDVLRLKNRELEEALEHAREIEEQIAERTSQEILKLVQENSELLEANRKVEEVRNNMKRVETQTDESPSSNELEEVVRSLKRENSELLTEMNEMNQALKERGETISKFQAHCEEVMKKLQIYESQANRNVDNISQKEEMIKSLKQEVEKLKNKESAIESTVSEDILQKKDVQINELRNEIESLKERINANMDSSYAESETMSTSTISRSEEINRLKDLEGSWEERYGKLRTLAVKLKGKVRDLSNELVKEQNEKNDIQQKCANNMKTISTLQAQCDELQDELETAKKLSKEYCAQLDITGSDLLKERLKIQESEEIVAKLKNEIDELNQEKTNMENWKKQISGKVQTFRKELDANKVLKKEFEAKIAKLTAELEAKEQALKAESDGHQQTKSSLEHSNNERMKNSVLNLEMQDYERSVKELLQKLEKKQEEVNKLKGQMESQKSTANAIREQNKLLEERAAEMKTNVNAAQLEIISYKKQIFELEEVALQKENKVRDLTQLLETVRSENEELSTELSKVIAEHQKLNLSLKTEKEHLRSQVLGLQQTLRDVQDTLKLKEDELKIIQNDYDTYKVRAQSVLRQNQNRDVGLEEKLSEELSALKVKCETLSSELNESKDIIEVLKKENEALSQEKIRICEKYEEVASEIEDLKLVYDHLSSKHQQTVIEHGETVRSLKVHAETLAQCYRQQLSEQEVRHNREIIELQSKIEKAPSPTELPYPPLPIMHREEGEGSESTETISKNVMHPVPLERLLGADTDQEVAFIKKQLNEEESKVIHLTALLADAEQDLAKHVQMNTVLKEEIRRQQRSVEREKHAENLEYLKNVVFKFVTLHSGDERSRLVPVLNTILKLSPDESQKLSMVAKGEPGIRGWTNYLPLWPSPSKPS